MDSASAFSQSFTPQIPPVKQHIDMELSIDDLSINTCDFHSFASFPARSYVYKNVPE